jgi:hypothetical protein
MVILSATLALDNSVGLFGDFERLGCRAARDKLVYNFHLPKLPFCFDAPFGTVIIQAKCFPRCPRLSSLFVWFVVVVRHEIKS